MQAAFVAVGPTKYIASGSEDNSIVLWDLNRKVVVQRLVGHTGKDSMHIRACQLELMLIK
jgi:WD40 repeat protein